MINMATLKKGGGQNVGLNFLSVINGEYNKSNFVIVAAENSKIHTFLENNNFEYFVVSNNSIKRTLQELLYGRRWIKKYNVELIYSYFGYGLYPKHVPQVVGSAVSNIYFPEINFWKDYSGFAWIKRKISDYYRLWYTRRSDAIIFENKAMEKRAKDMFPDKSITLILPSINTEFAYKSIKLPDSLSNVPKGLLLCGWQKNKNYHIIPQVASKLKERSINYHFIITADEDNSLEHREFVASLREYGVENMVSIIGRVEKESLKDLYKKIDVVILLSLLESFSNNIIEAWTFQRPLLISNEEWSKGICNNAAYYCNRDSSEEISIALTMLTQGEVREELIKEGNKELESYPTIRERTKQELKFLKRIYYDKVNSGGFI